MSPITNYFEPKKVAIKRSLKDDREEINSAKRPKLEEPPVLKNIPPTMTDKYRHLLRSNSSLILPAKYSCLTTLFNATEMISSLLHNRSEDCYFDKLIPSVERLTRRKFDENKMGQIKAVFPTAYSFFRRPDRRILVKANLVGTENVEGSVQFSLKLMNQRKSVFEKSLFELTHSYHQKFLSTFEQPIQVGLNKLKRWHPRFKLESVEDVESVKLIEDDQSRSKVTTARELVDMEAPVQIKQAIAQVVAQNCISDERNDTKDTTLLDKALSGLPAHLIAKVKENQSRKATKRLIAVDKNDESSISRRLPTLMIIIKSIFVTERKASLSLETLVERIMESYDGMLSPDDISVHVDLIQKRHSSWFKTYPTSGGEFVSLDKSIDINTLLH